MAVLTGYVGQVRRNTLSVFDGARMLSSISSFQLSKLRRRLYELQLTVVIDERDAEMLEKIGDEDSFVEPTEPTVLKTNVGREVSAAL